MTRIRLEILACAIHAGVRTVPRIRTVICGNSEPQSLDKRLHIVVPTRSRFRAFHRSHEDVPQIVLDQEIPLLIGQIIGFCAAFGIRLAVVCRRSAFSG
jgi:hypothetical protein